MVTEETTGDEEESVLLASRRTVFSGKGLEFVSVRILSHLIYIKVIISGEFGIEVLSRNISASSRPSVSRMFRLLQLHLRNVT